MSGITVPSLVVTVCSEHYLEFIFQCMHAAACNNLKVVSETYTSGDVLLSTRNVLIIQVELNCDEVSVMIHTFSDAAR